MASIPTPNDPLGRITQHSAHPLQSRIEQLKQLFPEAVQEGELDMNTLQNLLGKPSPQPDRYRFHWAGKQEAILSLHQPSTATLTPVPAESIQWDTTQHAFIEGDNLEVLKLLYKSYFGRVKLIYIDPPYNTGNDFIYPDDYTQPLEHYLRITGQLDENGRTRTSQQETNGRKHSAWLSMMYPRLFLARQLLREDGVIFISIDDNEVHHLRLLMNEIFGEENFVATFPWKKRTAKSDVPFGVSQDFEWVMCYAHTTSFFAGIKHDRRYYQTDDYPNDRWRLSDLTKQTSNIERPNSAFNLIDPKTGKTYPFNPKRVWAITQDTFQEYYDKGKIVFPDDYNFLNMTIPAYRVFESEDRAKALKKYGTEINMKALSTQFPVKVGMTENGSKEIAELLDEKIFPFPKPSSLIQYLVSACTNTDDLILDFFAGSATTAQAVLELNREDGGKRRFILVQLPEPTNNPTYPTIADISKERVRRVIERMHAQQTEQLQGWVGNPDEDLGFRVFKLQPSSIQSLDDLPEDASVAEQLTFLENPLKEGWSMEAVIAEVALKEMGFGLSYRIESVPQVVAHTVYRVVDDEREQSFYLCLDSTLTLEGLKPLAFKPDDLFVFLDSAIDDTVVANLILRCRIKRL